MNFARTTQIILTKKLGDTKKDTLSKISHKDLIVTWTAIVDATNTFWHNGDISENFISFFSSSHSGDSFCLKCPEQLITFIKGSPFIPGIRFSL